MKKNSVTKMLLCAMWCGMSLIGGLAAPPFNLVRSAAAQSETEH